MSRDIRVEPLTAAAFAPFGDVIEAAGTPTMMINQGTCARYHDVARIDFAGEDARPTISVFKADPCGLPYTLDLMERHPLGSQAFIPLSSDPFLVTVAEDNAGRPGTPRAFVTAAGQGVNYHRGTWHGVLTVLSGPGVFAVVDRIGGGDNVEDFKFEKPYRMTRD